MSILLYVYLVLKFLLCLALPAVPVCRPVLCCTVLCCVYLQDTMRPEEVSSTYSPCPPLQYGSGVDYAPPATHDTSRVNYHVKQIDSFAQTLQDVSSMPPPSLRQ